MPAVDQSKFYVTFVGGLNTESTRLNFPENAATDIDNVIINRNGEVSRRLGCDVEDAYQLSASVFDTASLESYAMSTSEWLAVNGKGEKNFLVIQIGAILYFHNLGVEPISAAYVGSLDLSAYQIGSQPLHQNTVDVSVGEGRIIVCNPNMDPIYITYDDDLNTFTPTTISIQIRDFTGLEDGLGISERISSGTYGGEFVPLDALHFYNLRNQGWEQPVNCAKSSGGSEGSLVSDPVYHTASYTFRYPSNADIIYNSKIGAVKAGKEETVGAYSPWQLDMSYFGNTLAPRGHYILDAFNLDYAAAFTATALPFAVDLAPLNMKQAIVQQRPACTAFYAGRVWYSGVYDKTTVGNIYFSQILTDITKIGNCYQEQDPTAEDLNSVLATDGGTLHVSDMGKVIRLVPMGKNLIVVASNGLWSISGSETGGSFKADDYVVTKIVEASVIGREAIVVVENALYFWDKGGIWQVNVSQISGQLEGNRISRDTIQTFYETIPEVARSYTKGFYDVFDKKIYWFYNDEGGYDGLTYRFKYNRALVLDLTLNAFYTYTFGNLATNTPFIAGITQKQPGSQVTVAYDVFADMDDVEETGDDVRIDIDFDTFSDSKLKLIVFLPLDPTSFNYSFGEFKSRLFVEWPTWDADKNLTTVPGVDYSSFIQGGWESMKDFIRLKHITHVTSFFNRTETGYDLDVNGDPVFDFPSSCMLQTRWDWTDNDIGRWTTPQEAYRLLQAYIALDENDPFAYGFEVVKTKLRMRGKGDAFSFRYSSSPGKDFQLIGLAVNIRAGTKV